MVLTRTLRFHAPCVIGGEEGFKQLEDRLTLGFSPKIMLKSSLDDEDYTTLIDYIRKNPGLEFSFDLGRISLKEDFDKYVAILNFVKRVFESNSNNTSSSIGLKFDDVFPTNNSHLSPSDTTGYITMYTANLDLMTKLRDRARRMGLDFEVENRTWMNYEHGPNTQQDPRPKWKGWGPGVRFTGGLLSHPVEIKIVIEHFGEGFNLGLDIEHLLQASQWSYTLNLSKSQRGIRYYGDLDPNERETILASRLPIQADNAPLFDYSNLTSEEEKFLEKFGFVIRPGQPPVSRDNIKLELDPSITRFGIVNPGFQVRHAYTDTRNGRHVHLIGSHMPGITKKDVYDQVVKDKLSREIKALHKRFWVEYIIGRNISDLELEPQIDNGRTVVYSGPSWREGISTARNQLIKHFEEAENGKNHSDNLPYYLK